MGLKDADGSTAELVALGAAVRRLRARHGWVPQNAVCFDADLGDGYLSDLELGRTNPRFLTLVAITRTLGFTLGDLIAVYEHKVAGRMSRMDLNRLASKIVKESTDPDAHRADKAAPSPEAVRAARRRGGVA